MIIGTCYGISEWKARFYDGSFHVCICRQCLGPQDRSNSVQSVQKDRNFTFACTSRKRWVGLYTENCRRMSGTSCKRIKAALLYAQTVENSSFARRAPPDRRTVQTGDQIDIELCTSALNVISLELPESDRVGALERMTHDPHIADLLAIIASLAMGLLVFSTISFKRFGAIYALTAFAIYGSAAVYADTGWARAGFITLALSSAIAYFLRRNH